MSHLLAALAELLGYTALVAHAPKRASARVSTAIASFAFFFFGAVVGGPAALANPALPSAVTVGLVLAVLVLLLAVLKAMGVPVGAASSVRASLGYAAAFFGGAFGLLLMLAAATN